MPEHGSSYGALVPPVAGNDSLYIASEPVAVQPAVPPPKKRASVGPRAGALILAAMGCAALIGRTSLVKSSMLVSSLFSRGQLDKDGKEEEGRLLYNSSEWRVEKYTINIRSETALFVNKLSRLLCEPVSTCPSDLGCGSERTWCEVALPFLSGGSYQGQLHWVDANSLNDLRYQRESDGEYEGATDWWINYFEELNGDLDEWNAFLHNGVQLYSSDLAALESRLSAEGLPMLKRLSVDSSGVEVAHIGITIAGKLYEMFGSADSLTDLSDYSYWTEEECPIAHVVDGTLSEYSALAKQSEMSWLGSPALVWAGASVAHGDPTATAETSALSDASGIWTLYDHLERFTGAQMTVEEESESCTVTKLSWAEMGNFGIRYVRNSAAASGSKTLADYDDYASEVREKFKNHSWYGWDHMMDQHLGIWYSGAEESCLALSAVVREGLESADISVGERQESDAHEMYSGYSGSISWEYQWENCDAGRTSSTEECACVSTNNLEDWKLESGAASCIEHDDNTDWCGI